MKKFLNGVNRKFKKYKNHRAFLNDDDDSNNNNSDYNNGFVKQRSRIINTKISFLSKNWKHSRYDIEYSSGRSITITIYQKKIMWCVMIKYWSWCDPYLERAWKQK